jgi:hypothetical protein
VEILDYAKLVGPRKEAGRFPFPSDISSVVDPDPDPGGQKLSRKIEVLDVLWRAEGVSSCNLYVLYGGLEISRLQFLIKKRF